MHFLELLKTSVSTEISNFEVFISRVDHFLTIRTKIWTKIASKKLFLKKKKKKWFFKNVLPKTIQHNKSISKYR